MNIFYQTLHKIHNLVHYFYMMEKTWKFNENLSNAENVHIFTELWIYLKKIDCTPHSIYSHKVTKHWKFQSNCLLVLEPSDRKACVLKVSIWAAAVAMQP